MAWNIGVPINKVLPTLDAFCWNGCLFYIGQYTLLRADKLVSRCINARDFRCTVLSSTDLHCYGC
jgi:hypothetical protein